jgi:hypothetical protein
VRPYEYQNLKCVTPVPVGEGPGVRA